MSAKISDWLLEDIDLESLESEGVEPLATTDIADYYNSPGYSNAYNDYYDYSVYYNYYDYSVYYNYYNYSNYSNSISVTMHPISQSALINEVVTFSVGASNTIDSCQWYVANSPDGVGTAISGATSPTLSLTVSADINGSYYYCVVRRGGNSAVSNRAMLTVMSVNAFDIYTNVGYDTEMFFVRANPSTTEIVSATVSDPSIASVTSDGVITGLSVGTTTCEILGSNGATATFNITVLSNTIFDRLNTILSNTAIAIREYKGISYSIYPNQMASLLRGNRESIPYEDLEEMIQDIADAIREVSNSTDSISPEDFYIRILSSGKVS